MNSLQAGIELHRAQRLIEAEQIYRGVIAREPENAEALHLLGVVAGQCGRPKEALEFIGKAVAAEPVNPIFLNNLGNAMRALGDRDGAAEIYRRALAAKPDFAEATTNLGFVLHDLGQAHEAMQAFELAIKLAPDNAEAHNGLGIVLQILGHPDRAEQSHLQALKIRPDFVEAQCNLGQALRAQGRLQEAEHALRQTLLIKEDCAQAHLLLGNVLRLEGRLEEAERSYRRAIALDPRDAATYSNLLFQLNYIPGKSSADIFLEHREFSRRFAAPSKPEPHPNSRDTSRTLRIGYVSGDFRDHALAFFIEPVLAHHDRKNFEIFCYDNAARADGVTQRLQSLAAHWRHITLLDDDAVSRIVRDDAIDILVDLSGHSGANRLVVFGRKPAPVQATWLGYLNTTGLEAVDYRIADPHASPRGAMDALHSERLVRMPVSQWCYRPPAQCPGVSPPPCDASGAITFAALTSLAKVGAPMHALWAQLLTRVPGSRLLVVGAATTQAPQGFVERFTRHGVSEDRIQFLGWRPFPEYLALHRRVDIVLDTFPYSGGTTTCHALWMGVPVVSLTGESATSRGGASLLHAVGLPDLVADSPARYLEIAAALAADPTHLRRLRAAMRERMRASPLMDERRFTRNLERVYRAMWRAWCKERRS